MVMKVAHVRADGTPKLVVVQRQRFQSGHGRQIGNGASQFVGMQQEIHCK
jgi:hypothetical protein